ncbi:MAG: hypothetical protein IPK60_08965 [Sandaracinaceae bacterium]|jgi:triacylglycerol lipase|nr:hypothetical protein [Sandaracinaceae bacterium]
MKELVHRVYLIPGMFGFGRLAGYDYFGHLEREIRARYIEAGVRVVVSVVPTPPTASIRRRAEVVAREIGKTAGHADSGPIHLIGHSTGGLDARVIMSPTVNLGQTDVSLDWRSRVETVLTINTPHRGTPLASFFTTVAGTRLLYVLSLVTVTTLSVGRPPLALLSSFISAVGALDEALGIDIRLLDRATDVALRFIGEQGRAEVSEYLDGIRNDLGGILQISPETMDLFNTLAEDAPGVRYGSVVSASPPPAPLRFARSARSAMSAFSITAYSTLYGVTSRPSSRYPYPRFDQKTERMLIDGIGRPVDDSFCDGVVPTRSMVWGELLWCGKGDHLDVVGHFRDEDGQALHIDWLTSGASYGRYRFRAMVDALANAMLKSVRPAEMTSPGNLVTPSPNKV